MSPCHLVTEHPAPLRARLCTALDVLRLVKIAYHQQQPYPFADDERTPSYADMQAAARTVLELRNEALTRQRKRPRPITSVTIANLIR